uniref:ASCH domain-containing protein n=1 Tax=Oryza meridionalis TaxID=40149 RepID=A0A0E0DNL1_9ORYZ
MLTGKSQRTLRCPHSTKMASSETPPPPSPSPGTGGAVPLAPALVGLLRFVLSSHLASPDPALPLFPSYCSRLLLDDDDDDQLEKLAAGLARCVEEGRLPVAAAAAAAGIPAGEAGSEEREREWEAVVLEKGNELKRMYDAVEFELHVQEPYFTQLRAGTKKVEGRLAAGNYNRIAEGSLLLFNKCLLLNVQAVRKYASFSEMLQAEMISEVLPGVGVYRKFYTEEKESLYGVLAISVSKPTAQPYITMTELLASLGSDGLGRLLGMVKTAGTVQDGLPPPRSVLISSCMKLHQPNVNGCSLTDAARALAKHVHRSSDGWWGSFHGSDVRKNQLASEIIDRLLRECCWMNIHLTQPYGPVYEIRVHEGYGARWSQDGSKFIGFLEPYSPEGFSKGWKH